MVNFVHSSKIVCSSEETVYKAPSSIPHHTLPKTTNPIIIERWHRAGHIKVYLNGGSNEQAIYIIHTFGNSAVTQKDKFNAFLPTLVISCSSCSSLDNVSVMSNFQLWLNTLKVSKLRKPMGMAWYTISMLWQAVVCVPISPPKVEKSFSRTINFLTRSCIPVIYN